jgi:hypothetical protein
MASWKELVNLLVAFILSGFVSTIVVQWVKNCRWGDAAKVVVALGVSALVGLAQVWVSGGLLELMNRWGELTAADIIAVFGATFAGASFFYKTKFADTSFMKKLESAIWGCPPATLKE